MLSMHLSPPLFDGEEHRQYALEGHREIDFMTAADYF
jgi:hypothetical protein